MFVIVTKNLWIGVVILGVWVAQAVVRAIVEKAKYRKAKENFEKALKKA